MNRLWPSPGPVPDLVEAYAPHDGVRMNFVTSLDGAVEVDGYSRGLSSEADQAVLRTLRVLADVVLVGAGTLRHEGYGPMLMDGPTQAQRTARGLAPHPTLVIVSSSLDLDPARPVFRNAPARPIVLTHGSATAPDGLADVADVVACGDSVVDLAVGLGHLRERGLTRILSEGGPHLFGALLAADLVDELCLTLSPQLTGPGSGRIVAGTIRPNPQGMRLVHVLEADGDLITRYARQ